MKTKTKKIETKAHYLYFIRISFFHTTKTVLKIGISKDVKQRHNNFIFSNNQKFVSNIESIKVFQAEKHIIEKIEQQIIDEFSINSLFGKGKDNDVYKDLKFIMEDGKSELIEDTEQNIKKILEITKNLYFNQEMTKSLSFKLHNGIGNKKIEDLIIDFKSLQKDNLMKKELYSWLLNANEIHTWKDGKRIYRKYFYASVNNEIRVYFMTKYSKTFYTLSRIDNKGALRLESLLEYINKQKSYNDYTIKYN